jgi:PIN domain nuclease of toxin-antitoxin system
VILLDSHVVVWLLLSPGKLSDRARGAILQARIAGEQIAFSPVTLYEIANAARRGRLTLYTTIEEFVAAVQANLAMTQLTPEIAICAAELPQPFHGDPMDRIIAATAIVLDCNLITHDDRIRRSNACKVLW